MKIIEDVRHFMERIVGIEYHGRPRVLPKQLAVQRVDHLFEEVTEYTNAGDLSAQLDALVDLVYIAVGNAYLHGFPFETAWDRVHAANMTKVGIGIDAAGKQGVIKPNGWQPPYLTDLVTNRLNVDRVRPRARVVICQCGLCACEEVVR